MERVAGTVYVRAAGQPLSVAGACTVGIKPLQRQTLSGLSGPAGYSEQRLPSFVEVEVYDTRGTDLDALFAAADVDVQAELANGKVATLTAATQMNPAETDGSAGTATLRFEALHENGAWS